MRPCIVLTALFLSCSTMQIVAADNLIKPGHNINDVSKVMQESGYQETRLDMAPPNKDTDMKMWTVDEVDKGVMIVAFTTKDKKVLDISYFLCDERPKGSRKNFYFHVTEFYPKTREMQIRLPNKADSDSGK